MKTNKIVVSVFVALPIIESGALFKAVCRMIPLRGIS